MKNSIARGFGMAGIAASVLISACSQPTAQTSDIAPPVEVAEAKVKLAPPITTVKPGASVVFSDRDPTVMTRGNTAVIEVTLNEGYPSAL